MAISVPKVLDFIVFEKKCHLFHKTTLNVCKLEGIDFPKIKRSSAMNLPKLHIDEILEKAMDKGKKKSLTGQG